MRICSAIWQNSALPVTLGSILWKQGSETIWDTGWDTELQNTWQVSGQVKFWGIPSNAGWEQGWRDRCAICFVIMRLFHWGRDYPVLKQNRLIIYIWRKKTIINLLTLECKCNVIIQCHSRTLNTVSVVAGSFPTLGKVASTTFESLLPDTLCKRNPKAQVKVNFLLLQIIVKLECNFSDCPELLL